jgi:rhamnose transport system permease protein
LVLVSRFSTAKADLGQGFELDAITAVVLGGTSISGGVGGIWGTVLGLLVVGAVRNGMTLAFINTDIQQMIIGGLLVASVALYTLVEKIRAASKGRRGVRKEAS